MALCRNILFNLKYGFAVATLTALLFLPNYSFAQSASSKTLSEQETISAISIAKQIEEMSLVENNSDQALKQPNSSIEARKQILEALTSGDKERFDAAILFYKGFAIKTNSQRDMNILNVFEKFADLYHFNNIGSNYPKLVRLLESYSNDKDWLVSFHSKRLLSILHTHSYKNSLALQSAQEALDLIPNNISEEAIESRILATELLAYLQNLSANKNLALVNTKRLIDLKLEANQPIDGIELINNLMFSLNEWRDYETRLELAKTLKRLENRFGSSTPGLSSTHIARIYNDIGNYQAAFVAAEEALADANIDAINRIATVQLATANAGLGNVKKAKELLQSVEDKVNPNDATLSYAKALLALKEGNTDEALSLMNQRYDRKVTQILKTTNRDTMEMLAGLENSSERQAEREAALQREAALIQTKLDQQQRINKLLIAFLSLVALSGICALLFARHRDKLAKLLAIKSREAESADRMKTEFLGMVSHELRTPLNGIIGLADILASSGPTEEVRQRGDIILTSGNILFSLIESIIDMSRLEAGKLELSPEPTSLKSLIESNLGDFEARAAEKGILFTSYISPDCDQEVELDPARVKKCIGTLLCNAVKFTAKGRVHLHVTSETDNASGQTEFTVIVADTGQGISEEVQTKLFTPFLQADASMTRKHGGSGLRLAISRMLARMMGGDITLTSREGRGSEFTLTFKSAEPAALIEEGVETSEEIVEVPPKKKLKRSKKRPQPLPIPYETTGPSFLIEPDIKDVVSRSEDLSRCRALIVEDIRSNQDVIALMLDTVGLQYVPVESGEAALSTLETQRFDFVLMDIHMPGMNGIETTKRIRTAQKEWSDIPIIALTADSGAENNAACMAAGANMFLTKPVMAKQLIEAIQEIRKQSQDEESARTNQFRKHHA